jgi:hypothetical protein
VSECLHPRLDFLQQSEHRYHIYTTTTVVLTCFSDIFTI